MGSARPPIKALMTEKILRQSREAESALADALVSSNTLTQTSFESFFSTSNWPPPLYHDLHARGWKTVTRAQ